MRHLNLNLFLREKPVFYFFHIPKTAGTSLSVILSRIFDEKETCPAHLWHELLTLKPEQLSRYRFFRGHFYASLDKLLPVPFDTFTFLRNPIDRALSHYGHVIRDPDHYLHKRAVELGSFSAYLRDPITKMTVFNFQSRALVLDLDPVEIASRLTQPELAAYELERLLETTPTNIGDDELFVEAKEQLMGFGFVGITERFNESLALLSYKFRWAFHRGDISHNVNLHRPKRVDISEDDIAQLHDMNQVDIKLYHFANEIFEARYASMLESLLENNRRGTLSRVIGKYLHG